MATRYQRGNWKPVTRRRRDNAAAKSKKDKITSNYLQNITEKKLKIAQHEPY